MAGDWPHVLSCVKPQQLFPPHLSPWSQRGPQGLQDVVLQGGGQGAERWSGGQSKCRDTAAQILLYSCLCPKSVTQQGISGVKSFGKYQSRQPEAVNLLQSEE